MLHDITLVTAPEDRLGESPVWSVPEQALYWVDVRKPSVKRLCTQTGNVEEWLMPSTVGSLALRQDGGLIVALKSGIYAFYSENERFDKLADPEPDHVNRFNDGRCDRAGRFWVGSMFDGDERKSSGALYRLNADYSCTKMLDHIYTPNSLCWSLDNTTMYFADTHRRQILAYEFSLSEGTLGTSRIFADLTREEGRPDGSAIDSQGFLWNAEYGGSRIVRYAPDGRIDRTVTLPTSQPTCCCFGGPELTHLYVTTARQRLNEEQLRSQPLSGGVFCIDVGIRGLPEARYFA